MTDDTGDNLSAADRELAFFYKKLKYAATFQGRFAYLLMSIHYVNPDILAWFTDFDPHSYLFANMLYGITVMIYTRPNMLIINPFNRLSFSILGSCMFNYSSMMCFNWLKEKFPENPYLLTFLGFLSGRLMMVHLLAYLYHIDSRMNIPGVRVIRDSTYESIYY